MRSVRRVETNLHVQQEVLERSYSSVLQNLKNIDQKFLSDVNTIQTELEEQRKSECQNLQKSLLALAMVIKKLKSNISDEEYLEKHDIDHFKNHLQGIEEKLSSFKALLKEQLETLTKEEQEVQETVDILTERLNESSRSSTTKPDVTPGASVRLHARSRIESNSVFESMHPDIKRFQQFLQKNGGHSGGWDTPDHLLFVRLLQRYCVSDQLTAALLDQLPDKTPEDVMEHEVWYHEYLTLKESHRKALIEWRKEQKQSHQKEINFAEVGSKETTKEINQSTDEKNLEIKTKIQEWKKKQEEKRKQQMEDMQEKKLREEEKWRQKVAYFECQRKKLAALRKEQQEALSHAAKHPVLAPLDKELNHLQNMEQQVERIPLKEFWEQDKQFMQRRRSRIEQYRRNTGGSKSCSRSSSQTTATAERDPARLLQPTAVWQARLRRSLSEEGVNRSAVPRAPLYIADVPHLGKPKWREGIV